MDLMEIDFDQAEIDISTVSGTVPFHWNDTTLDTHFFGDSLDPFPDVFLQSVSGPGPPSTNSSSEVRPSGLFGNDMTAFNSANNDANQPDPSIQFKAVSDLQSIVEMPDLDLPPMDALNPQLLVNPVSQNDLTLSVLDGFQALELLINHYPSDMLLGPLLPAELSTAAFALDGGLSVRRNAAEATIEPQLHLKQFATALHHNVGSMDSTMAEQILVEDHSWQITTTSTTLSYQPVKPAEKPMKRSKRTTPKLKLKERGEIIPGRFVWDPNSDGPIVPVRKRYSDLRRKEIRELKDPGACLRCSVLKKKVSWPSKAFRSYSID
jgi:hypothetical protein